mgnify:CR=1 FL=1
MLAIFYSRYKTWVASAAALLISILIFIFFSSWKYDDPFITYRYAANLAIGQGFVYNAGEHILSTTTPLFTLLLASAAWLTGKHDALPITANLIGALSLGAGGLMLWRLGEIWQAPLAGWTGLILYPTFPLLVNTLGSETPLYLALCLGALTCYVHEHPNSAALLAALATLVRPDGVLVGVVLLGDALIVKRKNLQWKTLAFFCLPLLLWVVFSWSYFGSPIPVTLAVKQSQAGLENAETFAPGLWRILTWFKSWQYGFALALALAGVGSLYFLNRKWLLLLGWTITYFIGYSLLGVSSYFWYYAPLVPGFIALIGLGLEAVKRIKLRVHFDRPNASMILQIVTAVVLAFLLLTQFKSLQGLLLRPDNRIDIYTQVGNWLNKNTPEHISVGCLETGIIGFYAQRRMIDFAGLLYPDIAHSLQGSSTFEDSARYALEHYHPEVVVLQEGLFPALEKDYLASVCRPMSRFQEDSYPYPLVIYNCQ